MIIRTSYRWEFPNITNESVVFDLGAYHGDWSICMKQVYECVVHSFEPVPEFYCEFIRPMFSVGVKTHGFGLGTKTEDKWISVDGSASSFHIGDSRKKAICHIEEIGEWVRKQGIRRVDVAKINIEGSEYELMEHILDKGLVQMFDSFLIQFHDFITDHEQRYQAIASRLQETHQLMEREPFKWEWWKSK